MRSKIAKQLEAVAISADVRADIVEAKYQAGGRQSQRRFQAGTYGPIHMSLMVVRHPIRAAILGRVGAL